MHFKYLILGTGLGAFSLGKSLCDLNPELSSQPGFILFVELLNFSSFITASPASTPEYTNTEYIQSTSMGGNGDLWSQKLACFDSNTLNSKYNKCYSYLDSVFKSFYPISSSDSHLPNYSEHLFSRKPLSANSSFSVKNILKPKKKNRLFVYSRIKQLISQYDGCSITSSYLSDLKLSRNQLTTSFNTLSFDTIIFSAGALTSALLLSKLNLLPRIPQIYSDHLNSSFGLLSYSAPNLTSPLKNFGRWTSYDRYFDSIQLYSYQNKGFSLDIYSSFRFIRFLKGDTIAFKSGLRKLFSSLRLNTSFFLFVQKLFSLFRKISFEFSLCSSTLYTVYSRHSNSSSLDSEITNSVSLNNNHLFSDYSNICSAINELSVQLNCSATSQPSFDEWLATVESSRHLAGNLSSYYMKNISTHPSFTSFVFDNSILRQLGNSNPSLTLMSCAYEFATYLTSK